MRKDTMVYAQRHYGICINNIVVFYNSLWYICKHIIMCVSEGRSRLTLRSVKEAIRSQRQKDSRGCP